MGSGRIKGSKNKKVNLNLCKDYVDKKEKVIVDNAIRSNDLFHIAIRRKIPRTLLVSHYSYIGLTEKFQYLKLTVITIDDILTAVCNRLQLNKYQILGKSRKRAFVEARYLCFTLGKNLTEKGLVSIGHSFNRHHSTVIHGIREYSLWMTMYPGLKEHYDAIYEMFEKSKSNER